jgi:hypothetical protein
MIFIDDNNQEISKRSFINLWSKKYNESNKFSYSYPVYFYFINKKNSRKKFLFLGAWKWNMVKEINLETANSIKINKQYFALKKGWSFQGNKREFPIFDYMAKKIGKLPKNNSKEISDFFYELMKIKNCGIVNTIFCIHILFPKEYPIYDQFVHYSMDYMFGNTGTENIIKKRTRYFHLYEYNMGYKYFYNKLAGSNSSLEWKRKIDKALWSFGKHISNLKDL